MNHVGVSTDLGVLSAEGLVQMLLDLYAQTVRLQQTSGNRPIVVHCRFVIFCVVIYMNPFVTF